MGEIMFADANTWDVVDWPKLRARLRHAPLPLSPRGHAELITDLANGKYVTGARWSQLIGVQFVAGADSLEVPFPATARADLRKMLTFITDGTAKERGELERWAAEQASTSVLISPSWSIEHGRRDRVIAANMTAAVVYGIWLLSDRRGEFEGTLCRCRYSKCGRFFFKRLGKSGLGAPWRRYCSARHRQLADREQARERMQRVRGVTR